MSQTADQVYIANKVKTATPIGLIILLYDGLIRFALDARDGFEEGTTQSVIDAMNKVTKCTNILNELNMSLNHEIDPDLCRKLSGLYTFFTLELSRALKERDPSVIDNIIPMIEELLDGWQKAESNGASLPPQSPSPSTHQPISISG